MSSCEAGARRLAGFAPRFARRLVGFATENLHFLVFLTGFAAFCGSLAAYSPVVAGASGGVILMAIAVYPFLTTRKS